MSHVIRINDDLYNRLRSHAEGFDTPAIVIERILDSYEANGFSPVSKVEEVSPASELEISFGDFSEKSFKTKLLKTKYAFITLHYTDGSSETKRWNASKFTEDSKLGANLRSGFLRGWRAKGIYKAELSFGDRNA